MTTKKHRRGGLPGAYCLNRFYTGHYWFGVVVDFLNSECSQQNRANESKNSANCQYIELQGKVHGRCLPC
jgi:hypothetical protein